MAHYNGVDKYRAVLHDNKSLTNGNNFMQHDHDRTKYVQINRLVFKKQEYQEQARQYECMTPNLDYVMLHWADCFTGRLGPSMGV